MKQSKRILSVILVLCMLFVLSVPALAAGFGKRYKHYETYLCLGDSIAAGCGLNKLNPGTETDFDSYPYAPGTPEYEAYVEDLFSPDCASIYRGYTYDERAPYAYHSLVAEALGIHMTEDGKDDNLIMAARSGIRSVELRYMIDGVYTDPDFSYWTEDCFGSWENLELARETYRIPENIKKADLITISLGTNDALNKPFSDGFIYLLSEIDLRGTSAVSTKAARLLTEAETDSENGNFGAAFDTLSQIAKLLGVFAEFVDIVQSGFEKGYALLKENYDVIIKSIYRLNPNATVVAVGMYNFFQNIIVSEDSDLQLSVLSAYYVNKINNLYKSYESRYSNRFYYANVMGTETYTIDYSQSNVMDFFLFKLHPTLAGYRFMADRILDCLPSADVPDGIIGSIFTSWHRRLAKAPKVVDFIRSWLPYITASPLVDNFFGTR